MSHCSRLAGLARLAANHLSSLSPLYSLSAGGFTVGHSFAKRSCFLFQAIAELAAKNAELRGQSSNGIAEESAKG